MFCRNCGNQTKEGASFCSACGCRCSAPVTVELPAGTAPEVAPAETQSANCSALGNRYRFYYCGGRHGKIQIIALPLFYTILYFTGDSVDFTFQENSLKILSSEIETEEPYANIKSISFQENVPVRRNFPLLVSLILSFLIIVLVSNLTQSLEDPVIGGISTILSLVVTIGASFFLKFGKKKRTALIMECKNGHSLCLPMKRFNEKRQQSKEAFLWDVQSVIES